MKTFSTLALLALPLGAFGIDSLFISFLAGCLLGQVFPSHRLGKMINGIPPELIPLPGKVFRKELWISRAHH